MLVDAQENPLNILGQNAIENVAFASKLPLEKMSIDELSPEIGKAFRINLIVIYMKIKGQKGKWDTSRKNNTGDIPLSL